MRDVNVGDEADFSAVETIDTLFNINLRKYTKS